MLTPGLNVVKVSFYELAYHSGLSPTPLQVLMPLGSSTSYDLLIIHHADLVSTSVVYQHILPWTSGLLLNLHNVGDHPVIVCILEQGWHKHFPLSLLTHDKCCTALFVDHIGLVNSSHLSSTAVSSLASSGIILDSSSECSISHADFHEAWPCLCSMIECHLASASHVEIAVAFCTHYHNLITCEDFVQQFLLYIKYDIQIHSSFVAKSFQFSPATFQELLWLSIVNKDHASQILAMCAHNCNLKAS
jgi:hypothetical protein